jgi:hypothetical protein
VQYAARDRNMTISVGGPDPLEHLVDRVGVGEDVMSRLPVACSLALPKRAIRSAAP